MINSPKIIKGRSPSRQCLVDSFIFPEGGECLLHLPQPYVDIGELPGDSGEIGLARVVGDEHLGLEHVGGVNALIRGHCVRLVDREESQVNVFEISHFGDILRVSGGV